MRMIFAFYVMQFDQIAHLKILDYRKYPVR